MLSKRIIPCLDVKHARVVKGVNFLGLQDAGDPVELAKMYNLAGADEICFLDIESSQETRRAMLQVIERTAREVFIPLTVGGGVQAPEDIRDLLRAGADKVSINSGAVRNPGLVRAGASQFGSQCIVVAIDVKKSTETNSGWQVYVRGGREATGLDALAWAKQCTLEGAGEILLTSMDADGTKQGYDLGITRLIASELKVPVIASGGAGTLAHIVEVFERTQADAALLASIVHYGQLTIADIKEALRQANIPIRLSAVTGKGLI